MKHLIVLVAVLLVGACAEFAAFRSGVAEHGADAADQTLDAAVWTMCNGISVGAVKRRFKTPEERAAYNVLCPQEELP